MDSIIDLAENIRPTKTDVQSNKKKPRDYNFTDAELNDVPKSRNAYRKLRDRDTR